MSRRLLTALVAGLIVVPTLASAQTKINIAGGASAPVGSLGDLTGIGYNASGGVNFGGTTLPVTIRLEGGINSFSFKNNVDGDIRIITGTANAIFNLSKTPDSPYLIGGLGAYNRRRTSNNFAFDSGKTSLGISGGGGLRFPLSGISTFFEARYHVMLGDSNTASNYQFVPITFGIMF